MSRVLICGTLAYDDIGEFATPLRADTRNVKLDRLHRGFGGCAMNIAYNLAGLGHRAVPFVYVGDDYAGDYAHHVARAGISEAGVFRVADTPSARGIVLTGLDGAQFTAFYPGPSGLDRWPADLDRIVDAEGPGTAFDALIVAPDLPQKMAGCAARGRDIALRAWCPGQYAELLSADLIAQTLEHIGLLVVNRHEWQAVTRALPEAAILDRPIEVVVTDGPGPVTLLPTGGSVAVPPVDAARSADPTGCGDAFVAGLVAGLLDGATLPRAAAAGITLAGRCLHHRGAQQHAPRG